MVAHTVKAQELCIPIEKDCVLPRVARSLGKETVHLGYRAIYIERDFVLAWQKVYMKRLCTLLWQEIYKMLAEYSLGEQHYSQDGLKSQTILHWVKPLKMILK